MSEVSKLLILHLRVSIPVSSPANRDIHRSRYAEEEACEENKPFRIAPDYRIRRYIHCHRRCLIMLPVRPLHLREPSRESCILRRSPSMPFEDGEIYMLNRRVEKGLQIAMTSLQCCLRSVAKNWHGSSFRCSLLHTEVPTQRRASQEALLLNGSL